MEAVDTSTMSEEAIATRAEEIYVQEQTVQLEGKIDDIQTKIDAINEYTTNPPEGISPQELFEILSELQTELQAQLDDVVDDAAVRDWSL